MINFIVDSKNLLSVIFSGNEVPFGLLVLIVLLWITLTIAVIYFALREYKKNFSIERKELVEKITQLKFENTRLENELKLLKLMFQKAEADLLNSEEVNKTLLQRIQDLENQIAELTKGKNPEDDDIIIEYYAGNEIQHNY